MKPLRIVGGLFVLVGLVLTVMPSLIRELPATDDLFEATERHVRWGALVGVGALLVFRTRLRPWRDSFAHLVLWIAGGYLLARFIGIAMEGFTSLMQWVWVAVEIGIVAIAAGYLSYRRRSAAAAQEIQVEPAATIGS